MAYRTINMVRLESNASAILNPKGAQVVGPTVYSYKTTEDNLATVSGSTYFDLNNPSSPESALLGYQLRVGDLVWCVATDGNVIMQITGATPNVTATVYSTVLDGSIDTADLADSAVDKDKLNADVAGTYLSGGAGTALDIVAAVPRTVTVTVSAAEFLGMYATPKLLVAAGGANTLHVVNNVVYEVDYGTAQFANGGVVAVQYDSTANGAGADATADTAAAVFTAIAADTAVGAVGELPSTAASSLVNKGLYLSNETAAFITGDSTVYVHLNYHTISTTV